MAGRGRVPAQPASCKRPVTCWGQGQGEVGSGRVIPTGLDSVLTPGWARLASPSPLPPAAFVFALVKKKVRDGFQPLQGGW